MENRSTVFMLDPRTDPYAVVALRAYSAVCRREKPNLADAIDEELGKVTMNTLDAVPIAPEKDPTALQET